MSSRRSKKSDQKYKTVRDFALTSSGTITAYTSAYTTGAFWVDFAKIVSDPLYGAVTPYELLEKLGIKTETSVTNWADFAFECIKNDTTPLDVHTMLVDTRYVLLTELVGKMVFKHASSQRRDETTLRLDFPMKLEPLMQKYGLWMLDAQLLTLLALNAENVKYLKVKDLKGINLSPVQLRALHQDIRIAYGLSN